MLDKKWSGIMQEVDALYHTNLTSEGRIDAITDYIVRLLNAETERCAEIANAAFFEVNDGRPISAFQAKGMSKQLAHQIAEAIRKGG